MYLNLLGGLGWAVWFVLIYWFVCSVSVDEMVWGI